ncbi:hypothetical protein SAMN04487905_10631 [Actinopolyspora xinjiangensis]|uniref:Uncharacterized protein n=1 Tax=Actinopolyspora xinjiangensis TaxID=405564 RepID=A0A1H0U487_9ACTN|nr:hypothetical protein [Actinopolyspora xinjiangensis]SDP60870.1 hypothetical protein SAMN04487905_10631 [Actinopolyspora xinjiangensis]
MPKSLLAQILVLLGAMLVVAGVCGLLGWEVAALVAGAECVAYGLLFVDVDADGRGR